jgi:hypothetical protein
VDKQHLLCHELAGTATATATAFFCARNSSALYQQAHRMSVTKDKMDLHNASQINDEGLFELLASEFLSELYLYR